MRQGFPAASCYRPRNARESPLYRAVEDHLETFLAAGSAPAHAEASFRFFLECGVPRFGLARFACPGCKTSLFVPFSCKKRGSCPSCDAKRSALSSSRMLGEILPFVPYRQWVLVVPKRLRYFVNRDPCLAGELSRALSGALERFYRERASGGGLPEGALQASRPAQIHVIQRFGSKVNLHVHVHAVVSDGVFSLKGDGALAFAPASPVSQGDLERLSQDLRRSILRRLARRGLIPEASAQEMLAWPHGGFSLNAQVRIKARDRAGLERLLSYCLRPAVSVSRLGYSPEKGAVRYHVPRDRITLEWPAEEFLRRLSLIIPPPRVNLVRYYGALGPRSPLRRLAAEAARRKAPVRELQRGWKPPSPLEGLLLKAKTLSRRAASGAWVRMLARVFEAFPLLCRRCNLEMRPVAAVTEAREVTRILKHLGLPVEFPAAKPARSPPRGDFDEDCPAIPPEEAFRAIDEFPDPAPLTA